MSDAATSIPQAPDSAAARPTGLSTGEAAARLAQAGPNLIEQHEGSAWRRLGSRFWAPVPWMLEAVIVLQLALGRRLEATVIAALLVFNAVAAQWQERRARDALTLLCQRLQVTARVLRDGRWQVVSAQEVVPGDVLHLRTGDIVAADLELFEGSVSLDQSTLTGESLPVDAGSGGRAYTGAVVQRGEASGFVTATGSHTFFGRTAELVRHATAPSHMQMTILAIVKRLVIFDLGLVVLVAVFAAVHHLPALEAVEFALMLLVASVPVALPATYTLATALGSQSLARQRVLVTRLPAVEDAAAMDTLVSDKTGTLTQNHLTFAAVRALAPDTSDDEVLRAAALASDDATQDPIDLALMARARDRGLLESTPVRTAFLPFDPTTRRSEADYLLDGRPWRAVKGGSGAIAALCGVDDRERDILERAESSLAADGMRVLAVAAGESQGLRLLGVVGLSDPVRPDAAALIARLSELGVRVRMATGDGLETALAVGKRLALGQRVCHADAGSLGNVEACDLFARVLPEDKHAIVQALQHEGHVTGMTGDGVNDAPALRKAEVGVAVASATDVAKASAGAVLTEPGLAGVLALVTEGRQVHRRMLTYTLNKTLKTFEITILLTLGLWLTGEFVISSTLIVLLLCTNDFVTMATASDRVPPAPRPQRWRVGSLMAGSLALALLSVTFAAGFYAWARGAYALGPDQARTLAFLLLVFTNQAHVYVLRIDGALWSMPPSRPMLWATGVDIAVVASLAGIGVLMAALPWPLIGVALAATLAFTLVLNGCKGFVFRRLGIV